MITQAPCPATRCSKQRQIHGHGTGFTLIEVLIVVVVLGILLSIALPQYQRFLQRGYRVEAITLLTHAAACQERIRARTGSYDYQRCTGFSGQNQHYRLTSSSAGGETAQGFMLLAEPLEKSKHDSCGSLGLDHTGTRTISGPAENMWSCWSGR